MTFTLENGVCADEESSLRLPAIFGPKKSWHDNVKDLRGHRLLAQQKGYTSRNQRNSTRRLL